MTEKTFWFTISNDYRSGPSIDTYNKPPKDDVDAEESCSEKDVDAEKSYSEDDETPSEADDIDFEVPEERKIRIYVVNEYPSYEPIWYEDIDEDEGYKNMYLKIFSQIHGCMPFKVSGYTSSYKEKGEYPDVSKEIEEMPNVLESEKVDEIENDDGDDGGHAVYFFFAIDSNGDEITTELLIPIC